MQKIIYRKIVIGPHTFYEPAFPIYIDVKGNDYYEFYWDNGIKVLKPFKTISLLVRSYYEDR